MTWYDDHNNRLEDAEEQIILTTPGRVLFNRVLPEEVRFVNLELDKGGLKDLMAGLYEVCGEERTPEVADEIKDIGFRYATRSGYSLAVSDITVPEEKGQIIDKALAEQETVTRFPPGTTHRAREK
jgi:DNA-directed RNA polymerase subunit beta'